MTGKKAGQAAIESRSGATAGRLHAQAAMEYLMTYGWALLVIVIVIAILLIMNPFSAPQSCRFDQIGFTCESPVLAASGQLYMRLGNGNNNAVKLLAVKCTTSRSTTPPTLESNPVVLATIPRQGTFEINNANKVTCSDSALSAGSEFSGKVWLFYNNEEDGADYPVRTASANLVTKVV